MKAPHRIHDPFHNPFHNRFHVPVHSRVDEMQAFTHMVWLNEPVASDREKADKPNSRPWVALAGAFGLVLVLVFSAALLSN